MSCAASVLTLSAPSSAQTAPATAYRPSHDYVRCLAQDESHVHMTSCLEAEQRSVDAALDATWRATMARLPRSRGLVLRGEERRWISRREADCAAEEQAMAGGNGGWDARLSCLIHYANARIADLRKVR